MKVIRQVSLSKVLLMSEKDNDEGDAENDLEDFQCIRVRKFKNIYLL